MTALTTVFEIASIAYILIAFLIHTNATIDRQLAPATQTAPVATPEPAIVQVDEVQPLPMIHVPQTIAYTAPVATPETEPALTTLPIRELKKLASSRKIRGYSNLTKVQLVEALTA